ncbi:MAG: hypothetical protein ACTHN0_06810 [Aquihabitans sp.]
MSRCRQELCPHWAGDGGCPCVVLGIDPPRPDDAGTEAATVTWRVKARTMGSADPHARFHHRDWLTVEIENGDWVVDGVLICRCPCGNPVYLHAEEIYKRKELTTT